MLMRGERELENGNVSSARQFFLRAAEAGMANGASCLPQPKTPMSWAVSASSASSIAPSPENGTSAPRRLVLGWRKIGSRGSVRPTEHEHHECDAEIRMEAVVLPSDAISLNIQ